MKKISLIILTLVLTSLDMPKKLSKYRLDDMVLKHIVRQPKVKTDKKPPVLIMLHGVGSNEQDLFRWANLVPDEYLVISAQAPYHYGNHRYGWYQVRFEAGKSIIDEAQAEQSRKALITFISQVIEKYDVDANNVHLMGFSQGTIMSFAVALTRPELIKSVGGFSGRILKQTQVNISKDEALKKLRIFLVHSTNDRVLRYDYAKEQLFDKYDIPNTFITEQIGHSMSQNGFLRYCAFLKEK